MLEKWTDPEQTGVSKALAVSISIQIDVQLSLRMETEQVQVCLPTRGTTVAEINAIQPDLIEPSPKGSWRRFKTMKRKLTRILAISVAAFLRSKQSS